METNPSKMNMETADLSPTEWLEKCIIISKEELELSKNSNDDNYKNIHDKRKAQYDLRMACMAPLFASQPRLEKICKDWKNKFLSSYFTRYTFIRYVKDSVNDLHEKANDLEYLIKLFGSKLTYLDVSQYPTSQIMPIINANCPNLEELYLGFKEIMSQDFENVFSNMSHLTKLSIQWKCKNSTLPMTLAKSLEKLNKSLKILILSCTLQGNDVFSPDPLASVFPRLIALNCLEINSFGLSQLLLESIGEIKNLANLRLMSFWPKNHPMFDTKITMYPIGNLTNLEKLFIFFDYGVTDEFLINLCNNAKKLKEVHIIGTNITDIGMNAIDNLPELKDFNLGLDNRCSQSEANEFITDESIQCLFNKELWFLNISNCIKITDKGIFKLVNNLPNLIQLYITKNANVTNEAVSEIYKFIKYRRNRPLIVYDGLENFD